MEFLESFTKLARKRESQRIAVVDLENTYVTFEIEDDIDNIKPIGDCWVEELIWTIKKKSIHRMEEGLFDLVVGNSSRSDHPLCENSHSKDSA